MKEYEVFWIHYLKSHEKPATRGIHILGTTLAMIELAYIYMTGSWFSIWLVLVLGYIPAWFSHLCIEGNKPASLEAPFWALWSDLRMTGLWWTNRLRRELIKHGYDEEECEFKEAK